MPKFEVVVTYIADIEAEIQDRVIDALPSQIYLDYNLGSLYMSDADVDEVSE